MLSIIIKRLNRRYARHAGIENADDSEAVCITLKKHSLHTKGAIFAADPDRRGKMRYAVKISFDRPFFKRSGLDSKNPFGKPKSKVRTSFCKQKEAKKL